MNDKNRELYLELIKQVLTDSVYKRGSESEIISGRPVIRWITTILEKLNLKLSLIRPFDSRSRDNGTDWPKYAHTMIGIKRLNNIQFCIEKILKNQVPGDLIETGVWRGGTCIFMRAVLKTYHITNRTVWVADSFQGLPKPDTNKYPFDSRIPFSELTSLKISLNEVKRNFQSYDLLDNQVKFLKGWFKDTLPQAPIAELALIRIDGDMYESTFSALTSLYHKLSPKGYLIIDDFGDIPACKQAVLDFRKKQRIKEKIIPIDKNGVYWRKDIY